ncbi:BNR repeat-containing protein [Roseomonas aeriglobus]|nr:BNR repeat-containing protein [Roseomonas aeriglobus]
MRAMARRGLLGGLAPGAGWTLAERALATTQRDRGARGSSVGARPDGKTDRAYMLDLLRRMAAPVLSRVALGQLQRDWTPELSPTWDGHDRHRPVAGLPDRLRPGDGRFRRSGSLLSPGSARRKRENRVKGAIGSGLIALATLGPAATAQAPAARTIEAIDRVWSSHAVGFAIAADTQRTVVAYYDANRQLSVAVRARSGGWTYHRLDSWTGWDSHNYVAAAIDADGQIHVVANLHNDPLVYFRTTRAGDPRTLTRIATLVDPARERRMTYPVFLRSHDGTLILKYRDGGSGNGNEIYVAYDLATRRWRPLLATPLADGEGRRNAYFVGPVTGPDGRFHLAWVWRDTPDAATNHDLSYAVSDDLMHWQRSDGRPLDLPLRLDSSEIVDPVPVRAGMINNNSVIGFDRAGRPIITYHKFVADGSTQIFLARREARGWRIAQASRWRGFRWDFGGGGSLASRLIVFGARPGASGQLVTRVIRDGRAIDLVVDDATLAPIAERPARTLADTLRPDLSPPSGMVLNTAACGGSAIAWASRPPNRDQAPRTLTEPTTLYFVSPPGAPHDARCDGVDPG